MAGTPSSDLPWLGTLETEFDSLFRELYRDLSDPAPHQLSEGGGEDHWAAGARGRVAGLASVLGQLLQKARVLARKDSDKKVQLDALTADLVESKSANSVLARELRSRTLQVRSLEMQLRGGSGGEGEGRQDHREMDALRAQLEFEVESYHQSPAEGEALRAQLEHLEGENTALHTCVQGLYAELAAAAIGTAYLELEVAGRVQQLQLLVKGVSGEELKQLWHQLYTEISLQKNKRLLLAYRARDRRLDELVALSTPCGDKQLRQKVLEFAAQRNLGVPEGRHIRKVLILKKETESLGMSITGGAQLATPILISNMEAGKPAHTSGKLQIGDALISVNEQSLAGSTHEEAVHLLRNSGSKVALKVVFMLGLTEEEEEVGSVSVGPEPSGADTGPPQLSSQVVISGSPQSVKRAPAATDLGAAGEAVFIAVEKLSSQEGAALVEQSESPRRSNTDNLAASFGLHVSSSSPCSVGVEADCGVAMFSHNEVQDYQPQAGTPTGGRSPSVGHSENASLWRPGDAQSTLDGDSTSVDVVCVDSVSERSSCVGTGSCSGGGGGGREGGGYGLQVHVLPVPVQTECREGPHLFQIDS